MLGEMFIVAQNPFSLKPLMDTTIEFDISDQSQGAAINAIKIATNGELKRGLSLEGILNRCVVSLIINHDRAAQLLFPYSMADDHFIYELPGLIKLSGQERIQVRISTHELYHPDDGESIAELDIAIGDLESITMSQMTRSEFIESAGPGLRRLLRHQYWDEQHLSLPSVRFFRECSRHYRISNNDQASVMNVYDGFIIDEVALWFSPSVPLDYTDEMASKLAIEMICKDRLARVGDFKRKAGHLYMASVKPGPLHLVPGGVFGVVVTPPRHLVGWDRPVTLGILGVKDQAIQ